MAKIITKILANRLAPHMNALVSNAQNAFIKKRCMHDNFIYVQRVIQLLHKNKRSALFIKLDISKAFDSIGWNFLLEVLHALGFSNKWRQWIAALLMWYENLDGGTHVMIFVQVESSDTNKIFQARHHKIEHGFRKKKI